MKAKKDTAYPDSQTVFVILFYLLFTWFCVTV